MIFFKREHHDVVLRIKKSPDYPTSPGRVKYACWLIFDDARTPLDLVIPCINKHLENWSEIDHPDVILKNSGELDRLYLELNARDK